MCSTPTIPAAAERQSLKLPDQGAPATSADALRWRRALLAGMVTSPLGLGGAAPVTSARLGGGALG